MLLNLNQDLKTKKLFPESEIKKWGGRKAKQGKKLHSFSVGLENSPDLLAARKAADYIGTVHHEITFTIQEGLDMMREVIWMLETYGGAHVRASVPMFLMARKIKSMGFKWALTGEVFFKSLLHFPDKNHRKFFFCFHKGFR